MMDFQLNKPTDKTLDRIFIKYFTDEERKDDVKKEMDNRIRHLEAIRELITQKTINIEKLQVEFNSLWPLMENHDKQYRKDFFKSLNAQILVENFINDILVNDSDAMIDKFIKDLVAAGYRPQKHRPNDSIVLQFTSVILSAIFPDKYVDFRQSRWNNLFQIVMKTDKSLFDKGLSNRSKMLLAGDFASQISKLPSFTSFFGDDHRLWRVAGLAWHFKDKKRYWACTISNKYIDALQDKNQDVFQLNYSYIEDRMDNNVAMNIFSRIGNKHEIAFINHEVDKFQTIYVGEVNDVKGQPKDFLGLKRLYCSLYSGSPPSPSPGKKGNWSDGLAEITDQKAIDALFYNIKGEKILSTNTIYYGPPGTGKTRQLLELRKNFSGTDSEGRKRYEFITFHQSYSYEDFVEGIKPVMTTCSTESKEQGDIAYEIRPGIFKKIVDRALADPGNEYALFIDEINRGNVASIFGELITIIEEDKRKDAEYETCVTLPYSQKDFFVPKNLHIYGAMNTADRSIEALDAALRRRFSFEAMYPDPGKIPDNSEGIGVNVPNLLEAINDRIEILKDKDHCIGHSYFMKVKSIDELNNVFRNKVLPLLEEYFYGDMAKIGMILGDKFVERDKHTAKLFSNFGDDSEYESAEKYRLKKQSKWSEGDFRSIYETVPTN
jgi:hypothetical protein